MSVELNGKIALVTGAGSGIGKGIALKLASCGAHVALHYYGDTREGTKEIMEAVEKSGGRAITLEADLTHTAEGVAMVEQVISEFGRLDILVSNAGISTEKPFFEVTEEMWDHMHALNLKA